MGKRKLVIHCASGLGNIGDEALLMSFLAKYKDRFDITVLCVNKDISARFTEYDKCLNDKDSRCFQVIKDCDIFVLGGGGLFQDETSIYNIYRWGRYLIYAKKLGKKTFVYANSVGPLNYKWSRSYVSRVMNKADAITLRDKESLDLLKKINVNNAVVTADGVFELPYTADAASYDAVKGEYVCVVVRHWFDCIPFIPVSICKKLGIQSGKNKRSYGKFIKSTAQIIDLINEKYDYNVVLLPFMLERDFKVSRDIIASVKNSEKTGIVSERDFGVYKYMSIIKNARFVIGMRLHSIIFSIMNETPFIALDYSKKVKALLDYLDFGELKADVSELKCEDIEYLIKYVENNMDEIKLREHIACEKMKNQAAVNNKIFNALIL